MPSIAVWKERLEKSVSRHQRNAITSIIDRLVAYEKKYVKEVKEVKTTYW